MTTRLDRLTTLPAVSRTVITVVTALSTGLPSVEVAAAAQRSALLQPLSISRRDVTGTLQRPASAKRKRALSRVIRRAELRRLSPVTHTVARNLSVNALPLLTGTPQPNVMVGSRYVFTPTASDADGDTLSYSIANLPTWATFDTRTGTISGTPTASHAGTTHSITISVSDGNGGGNQLAPFSITVLGTAPVISRLEVAQTHVIPAVGKTWSSPSLSGFDLHLAGDRQALVLVDVAAAGGLLTSPVVEAYVAATKVGEVALSVPGSLPPTEANGVPYSATAYWAQLDAAWVKPGLQVAVRANGGQRSALQAVKVGASTSFTMVTLPFYLFGLDTDDVPFSQTAAPDQATREEYYAKHPFSQLQMINHAAGKVVWPYLVVAPRQGRAAQRVSYKEQQGDGYAVMSGVLQVLTALRQANGDQRLSNQYYAPLLMATQAGTYSHPGGGLGGGEVGTGDYAYQGVFIHEAGHGFGLPHANDAYNAGTYPYVGGSLKGSAWGYDEINNRFLNVLVPTSASTYAHCVTSGFPMGRQLDEAGNCIKQDPMQSGAGDQSAGYKYTMFSDFNVARIQRFLEGVTTVSSGQHVYTGGKLTLDANSPTGYSRWDSIDERLVPASTVTTNNGLYGLDGQLPTVRDVPVHAIVITASIASITETTDPSQLNYDDTVVYDAAATQIYPPLSFVGNMVRTIDPSDAAQRASIVPNTGANPSYCRNTGCDYTLRVTFTDDSVQLIVLQNGFRTFWSVTNFATNAGNPLDGASYRTWGVNVPADKPLKSIELLETPDVYNGLPINPRVVASRIVN